MCWSYQLWAALPHSPGQLLLCTFTRSIPSPWRPGKADLIVTWHSFHQHSMPWIIVLACCWSVHQCGDRELCPGQTAPTGKEAWTSATATQAWCSRTTSSVPRGLSSRRALLLSGLPPHRQESCCPLEAAWPITTGGQLSTPSVSRTWWMISVSMVSAASGGSVESPQQPPPIVSPLSNPQKNCEKKMRVASKQHRLV